MASRKYIMERRLVSISDLSVSAIDGGGISLEEAEGQGVYKVNCVHQVGIATATEIGLTPNRYILRAVIVPADFNHRVERCDTVCSYWRVTTASNASKPFSRRPLTSDLCLRNLYRFVPDLDDKLWEAYNSLNTEGFTAAMSLELDADREAIYNLLNVMNPTTAQIAELLDKVAGFIAASVERNVYVFFKVADNAYLKNHPHGTSYKPIGNLSANKVALLETALTLSINHKKLREAYPTVSEGMISLAAYCAANQFRYGLTETYEHREYFTVHFSHVEGCKFKVESIYHPDGTPTVATLPLNSEVDVSKIRINPQLSEIASSCVVGSGIMHYMFNHTTGGMLVSGVLLTTLTMYNLISKEISNEEQTLITTVLYEVLHPTNKRHLANIFFRTSGVVTSGRGSSCPRMERFRLDAFMALRSTPYPAGSHKAFICIHALRKVLSSGLGPLLPWASNITECISICHEVMTAGARAHIGSNYYTGDPPKVQPASLDAYLPALAAYVHTFHRGDTLAMSPHLSDEMVKKSNANWVILLKALKSEDVSTTPVAIVRKFLATTGKVYFSFDPDDEGSWALAQADAHTALQSLDNVFN